MPQWVAAQKAPSPALAREFLRVNPPAFFNVAERSEGRIQNTAALLNSRGEFPRKIKREPLLTKEPSLRE